MPTMNQVESSKMERWRSHRARLAGLRAVRRLSHLRDRRGLRRCGTARGLAGVPRSGMVPGGGASPIPYADPIRINKQQRGAAARAPPLKRLGVTSRLVGTCAVVRENLAAGTGEVE